MTVPIKEHKLQIVFSLTTSASMTAAVDPHTRTPLNNSHLSEGLHGIADRVYPGSGGPGNQLVGWSGMFEDYCEKVIELGFD